ncbi:response regulator [Chloroflexota bacterium]
MEEIGRKKVLIADDESSVRSLLRRILHSKYIVSEASNGEEAVDMAQREKPDIILMDVMMPKLDGVGACSVIKSDPDTRAIPVIMVTARWQPLDQEYAKDMGADGYIVKPFDTQELMDTINELLMDTSRK